MDGLFAACSHCVQVVLHAMSVIETLYCTQQTGGLTRGMPLRAIHAADANSLGETGCSTPSTSPHDIACNTATVQFYTEGPSAPGGVCLGIIGTEGPAERDQCLVGCGVTAWEPSGVAAARAEAFSSAPAIWLTTASEAVRCLATSAAKSCALYKGTSLAPPVCLPVKKELSSNTALP